MVGSTGFEPATSASRTQRSARLSYDPKKTEFTNTPNRFERASSIRLAKKAVFFRYENGMNKTIFILISLLFYGCQNEENAPTVREPAQVEVQTAETIALIEHERLLGEAKAETEALRRKLTQQMASLQTTVETKEDQVEALEVRVLELTASLEAYKKQARDSKASLNDLKRLGSAEYKVIFERAKTVDNETAIALYEEFIEKFPDSPIAGKARSQLRKHMTERKILENRKNATTLRTWEIKLKGRDVRPGSARRQAFRVDRPSAGFFQKGIKFSIQAVYYVWRDYVLGQGGAYYDLLIHRTDDKVDRISFEE